MRALAVALLLALAGGCYTTYYHFDAPPLVQSPAYNGRWRTALIAGYIELSEPVSLDKGCPGGQVALIKEEGTVLNALLGGLLNAVVLELPIFHFRSVTMMCSPPMGAPTPIAPRPQ